MVMTGYYLSNVSQKMRKLGRNDKGEIIKKSEDGVLVCYDAIVKPQGRGGRIWPNPLPDHVGKIAKVIIFDKDAINDPERLVIQIQNQLKKLNLGIKC